MITHSISYDYLISYYPLPLHIPLQAYIDDERCDDQRTYIWGDPFGHTRMIHTYEYIGTYISDRS